MATYTAFLTSPALAPPVSDDEGVTWGYHAFADVIVMDAQGRPVAPYGAEEPWMGFLTLSSTATIVPSDSIATIRTKIMNAFRPNYVPTITASDVVRAVWLDSGGLLSL
jgi:hypothetical protein